MKKIYRSQKKNISSAIKTQNCLSSVSYRKVYSPMKVKAENVLTNVSHDRIKEVDLTNDSLIIDCYTSILFHLNPFFWSKSLKM